MAQRAVIIQGFEVKDFSLLGKDFPVCDILFISQFEEKFFRDILKNVPFYRALIADLADFSSAENFISTNTYAVNKIVKHAGRYYTKIAIGTTAPPNNVDWKLSDKFKSQCFNDFFCNYLGFLLANHIVRSQIFLGVGRLTGQGLVRSNGDNFDRMSSKDYAVFAAEIDSIIQTCYDNTINNIKETECLKDFRENTEGCGCEVIAPCQNQRTAYFDY